jgi:hypothetical protein
MYQEDSGKNIIKEELEDIKGVIRIRKSKNRQYKGQKRKGQTTIYKTYTYGIFKTKNVFCHYSMVLVADWLRTVDYNNCDNMCMCLLHKTT